MQKTVVSSAHINVSPDVIDSGRSFVNKVDKVGPKTEPCGTPNLTCIFEDFLPFITVNCFLSGRRCQTACVISPAATNATATLSPLATNLLHFSVRWISNSM